MSHRGKAATRRHTPNPVPQVSNLCFRAAIKLPFPYFQLICSHLHVVRLTLPDEVR